MTGPGDLVLDPVDAQVAASVRLARRDRRARTVTLIRAGSYALLTLSAVLAAVTAHPVTGALAAGLFAELAALNLRMWSLTGGLVFDWQSTAPIVERLRELCARAACEVPLVAIRQDSLRAAYVQQRRKGALLVVSDSFLQQVDDRQLAAVMAHEVVHLARGDAQRGRRRARALEAAAGCVIGLAAGATGFSTSFPIAIAGFVVAGAVVQVLVGLRNRRLELRADREGAVLCGDPAALAEGLTAAYRMSEATRSVLFAPPVWRWLLAPVSWRLPTHPPLQRRLELLYAQSLTGSAPSDDAPLVSRTTARTRHANLWLALAGLALFVGATLWTNHLDNHFAWLRSHGVHTTAVLTSIHCSERGRCGHYGRVSFATPAGDRSATIALQQPSRLRPGDQIPIAYAPGRPSDARSLEQNAALPRSELFAIIGYLVAIALWLTPTIRWWTARKRRRKVAGLMQTAARQGRPAT